MPWFTEYQLDYPSCSNLDFTSFDGRASVRRGQPGLANAYKNVPNPEHVSYLVSRFCGGLTGP